MSVEVIIQNTVVLNNKYTIRGVINGHLVTSIKRLRTKIIKKIKKYKEVEHLPEQKIKQHIILVSTSVNNLYIPKVHVNPPHPARYGSGTCFPNKLFQRVANNTTPTCSAESTLLVSISSY